MRITQGTDKCESEVKKILVHVQHKVNTCIVWDTYYNDCNNEYLKKLEVGQDKKEKGGKFLWRPNLKRGEYCYNILKSLYFILIFFSFYLFSLIWFLFYFLDNEEVYSHIMHHMM